MEGLDPKINDDDIKKYLKSIGLSDKGLSQDYPETYRTVIQEFTKALKDILGSEDIKIESEQLWDNIHCTRKGKKILRNLLHYKINISEALKTIKKEQLYLPQKNIKERFSACIQKAFGVQTKK